MSDIRLEREFVVDAERLFAAVTRQNDLLNWWGPEGMHVEEHALDLSRPGAWFAVMKGSEGVSYKVSGQVTHVNVPNSVGFTWGWHDDSDVRGPETHVTFTITETARGARLVIDHREFADEEVAENHNVGWTSSLNCLETYLMSVEPKGE